MRLQNFNSGVGATGSSPTTPNPNTNTTNQMPSNFNQMAQNKTPVVPNPQAGTPAKPVGSGPILTPTGDSFQGGGVGNAIGKAAQWLWTNGTSLGGEVLKAIPNTILDAGTLLTTSASADGSGLKLPRITGDLAGYIPGTSKFGHSEPIRLTGGALDAPAPRTFGEAMAPLTNLGMDIVDKKGGSLVETGVEAGTKFLADSVQSGVEKTLAKPGILNPIRESVPYKATTATAKKDIAENSKKQITDKIINPVASNLFSAVGDVPNTFGASPALENTLDRLNAQAAGRRSSFFRGIR